MIKKDLAIIIFLLSFLFPVTAQVKKQDLKREVTLYNPYKPTLPEAKKRSFLPDITDTTRVRPTFHYNINTVPFMPVYAVSPIKAAALLPDPLPKLYKSYINLGMGNYLTPLAEISISNERSKQGTFGFYGRHFSSNGKVELQNGKKVFAGYMDNDVSLYGRKFFRKNVFESSIDLAQKTRYAYGYDTVFRDYSAPKKDIRIGYDNLGVKTTLYSLNLDSTSFSYNFNLYYNYFYNSKNLYQHNIGFNGLMAKSYKGLYVGSGLNYDFYRISDLLLADPKFITSISPFIEKSTAQWSFKIGLQALLDKNMSTTTVFHLYPDMHLGFTIVPSYVGFFAELTGMLERNEPLNIISENPFLMRDGTLFTLPNTNHELIITAGLKGNTGMNGNYLLSASYSLISDMLFFTNVENRDTVVKPLRGNLFVPLTDDVDLFKIHAEMSGKINDKLSYNSSVNLYQYTLTSFAYAWNKPGWDLKLGLKYNLRDKIIAGMEISAEGKRREVINGFNLNVITAPPVDNPAVIYELPYHINLNLSAEYRYSKILSFWAKFNNISSKRYYEWAYYPSQRFLCMLGFTYSL